MSDFAAWWEPVPGQAPGYQLRAAGSLRNACTDTIWASLQVALVAENGAAIDFTSIPVGRLRLAPGEEHRLDELLWIRRVRDMVSLRVVPAVTACPSRQRCRPDPARVRHLQTDHARPAGVARSRPTGLLSFGAAPSQPQGAGPPASRFNHEHVLEQHCANFSVRGRGPWAGAAAAAAATAGRST
ncbi:MAG TPA: hypothetical protein VEQ11_20175 [Chloroflexota bacterium]|nr:hypothetical protein [Chloroflexota bacterium]